MKCTKSPFIEALAGAGRRSRARCSSPTIARAETSQNEQMRNVPSLPDRPSSVSSVWYRRTKPFSVRSVTIAATVERRHSSPHFSFAGVGA